MKNVQVRTGEKRTRDVTFTKDSVEMTKGSSSGSLFMQKSKLVTLEVA